MTLTTALTHGTSRLAHLPTARRDAELLLLHATGRVTLIAPFPVDIYSVFEIVRLAK